VAPITRTSEEHYRELLAANLDTAFFVGKAYALALQAAKQGGALVFFSTLAARVGIPNHAAIAAAKGAVEALTRAMAADHAATGLRVNCIAPGLMRTPMTEKMVANESAAKQIAAQYPLGRFGTAADAAALAAFLISDAATWITGQVIALDGGFSSVRPYVRNPSA
jgi:NAD(P)-dependent dehydrogenase (short-subunit alcohol dehydrogenase family)